MDLRYDVAVVSGFISPMVRVAADGSSGYLIIQSLPGTLNSTWSFFKKTSGSFSHLGDFAVSGLSVSQTSVRMRAEGSNIYFRVWNTANAEPSTWNFTTTDSSVTGAGYIGFYDNGVTSAGATSGIDNISVDNLVELAVSPTSVMASSSGNSLTLSATGTSWTAGTPGSPTFTVSGGTITAQTVASATTATLTFTAPSSGPITITDPSTGASISLTINSVTATDFTVSPSSQTTSPGVATGNYIVTPNGTPSSSVSMAFSDGGAGGTFTPSSLSFTTSAAKTFTYTPSGGASAGTVMLGLSATGGFSASHNASCLVSLGPQTIPVTNASLFWSPGNWDHLVSGTFGISVDTMQATAAGAYLKFGVLGTSNLTVNLDNATNSAFPSGDMPTIRYSIDGAAFTDIQLGPSQTQVVLSTSLSGAHAVEFYFKASSTKSGYADAWGSSGVSPTNVLRIKGIVIDGGASITAPTLLSKRMIIFGDSITAGEHVNTDGSDDATQSFAPLLARALGAEFAQIGYGGQGWEVAGASNVAAFKTAYAFYSAGRSRSFGSLDYIAVVHGSNDQRSSIAGSTVQSDVQDWLTAMRTACGSSTLLLVIVPPCDAYEANLEAGVATYKASSRDDKVYLIDANTLLPSGQFTTIFGPTTEWTYDGVHPLIYGHGRIGAAFAQVIATAITSASNSNSLTNPSHQLKRAR
jgi:lysophospholipase L1-like esterase